MPDDRWAEILRAAPSHAESNWQALPENGLGALIAYAAGPGRVRPHHAPLSERRVRVSITRDGQTDRRTEPMTSDDFAAIESVLAEYFTDMGLPIPPRTWWDIDPPLGMSADELCDQADRCAAELPGNDTGVERARREAQAILDHIATRYRESQ